MRLCVWLKELSIIEATVNGLCKAKEETEE
ncbi:MAG: hypothetical protein ACLUEC_04290 [Coprococcus sp.]